MAEVVTAEVFARLHAEYVAANTAYEAALARRDASADALIRAQCRVRYDQTADGRGRRIDHRCTLPAGHDGDHGKWIDGEAS